MRKKRKMIVAKSLEKMHANKASLMASKGKQPEPRVGLRARAMFDGKWVKGVISEIQPGKIHIKYDDGDEG